MQIRTFLTTGGMVALGLRAERLRDDDETEPDAAASSGEPAAGARVVGSRHPDDGRIAAAS